MQAPEHRSLNQIRWKHGIMVFAAFSWAMATLALLSFVLDWDSGHTAVAAAMKVAGTAVTIVLILAVTRAGWIISDVRFRLGAVALLTCAFLAGSFFPRNIHQGPNSVFHLSNDAEWSACLAETLQSAGAPADLDSARIATVVVQRNILQLEFGLLPHMIHVFQTYDWQIRVVQWVGTGQTAWRADDYPAGSVPSCVERYVGPMLAGPPDRAIYVNWSAWGWMVLLCVGGSSAALFGSKSAIHHMRMRWLRSRGKCPCGYDLRGLPEPRCPECGRPFDPSHLTLIPSAGIPPSGNKDLAN